MDDLGFGDDNQKSEKAKQSFLQLKQKICRTNDVIQQFSSKMKECERLKSEVEIAKKEADEWKAQHFASLTKVLKLTTIQSELEKSKKILSQEISELEIKIAGDQKHLQQLLCKLEDIEDRHSEKLMTIELQKSGLQTKITNLEQEIKLLHKTYNIKKTNNGEKPKRGRKIKSPMKTTRNTGLSPDINDKIDVDFKEINTQLSSPPHSINFEEINANEVDENTNSMMPRLPNLLEVDVISDQSNETRNDNLSKDPPIQKPVTCDQSVMTDEFYDTRNNIYPLQCDKCEALLPSMPIDKIYKAMTAVPPLISDVPSSPMPSLPPDHEIEVNNSPKKTNTSTPAQIDPNISIVLDKVQESLEKLEKKIEKRDKKQNKVRNSIPHRNHTFPMNCCGHSNNFMDDSHLSQVNMMTALWSSMMKLSEKRFRMNPIERKKISNKKPKRLNRIKKKMKVDSNSWTVESEVPFATDHDYSIDSMTKVSSNYNVADNPVEKMVEEEDQNIIGLVKKKVRRNIDKPSQTTIIFDGMSSDITSHPEDNLNCISDPSDRNLVEKSPTTLEKGHPTNSTLALPYIARSETDQNFPSDTNHSLIDDDLTLRKQILPANITQTVPKSQIKRLSNKSEKEPGTNDDETSQNTNIIIETSSNIISHLEHNNVNCASDAEDENLLVTPTQTLETNHLMNSSFTPSNIIEDEIVQRFSSNIKSPTAIDTTSRKQIWSGVPFIPKKRTGLFKKMRNLRNNDKLETMIVNVTKPTDYIESIDEGNTNASNECLSKANRRISHIKKNVENKLEEMTPSKVRKVTSSTKKTEESLSLTPTKIKSNSSSKNNILENIKNNLCGFNNSDEDTVSKIDDKLNDSSKDNEINQVEKSIVDNTVISESVEKNNEVNTLHSQFNVKNDKLDTTKTVVPTLNSDVTPQNITLQINTSSIQNTEDASEPRSGEIVAQSESTSIISSTSNTQNATGIILETLTQIEKNNDESPSSELNHSISDVNGHTLRKRKRISSITKCVCDIETPVLSKQKNLVPNSLTKKSEINLRNKKTLPPEIIQNEIGLFFNTRRIMTRSMKKNEESPSLISIKLEKPESSQTVKKLKVPKKGVDNTSIVNLNNLILSNNSENNKSTENIQNEFNEIENTSVNQIEIENSIPNSSPIHENDIINNQCNNKLINVPPEGSITITQDKKSITLPIKYKMENNDNFVKKKLISESYKEENFLESTKKIQDSDDNLKKDLNEKHKIKQLMNLFDKDEKIFKSLPTCENNSPSSPDSIPIVSSDTSVLSNTKISVECNTTTKSDNESINKSIPISTYETIYQSADTPLQSDEMSPIDSPTLNNSSQPLNDSIRELRNRIVPITPTKIISTLPKFDFSFKVEENEKIKNIKSFLSSSWNMAHNSIGKMKYPKYHLLASKKITDSIIDTVKQEMMRLIESQDWDSSIHESVVDNISKIVSIKSIANAIIDLALELALWKEPLDRTHTPPAPLMTPSQQKIIAVLMSLHKVKPDLISLIFDVINYNLFNMGSSTKDIFRIEYLSRVFVVLAKIMKDRERVRIFMCDAMYCLKNKSFIAIHSALTCWTEVLPTYNENHYQFLPMCIAHLIRCDQSYNTEVNSKKTQLKNLISFYYQYPETDSSINIVNKLLDELTIPNYDRSVLVAIKILAKREGTEWTYKNIVKNRLLQIIIENKNSSSYDALILLGHLMKCFPIDDPDRAVENIVEQLCGILDAGTTSIDIQEGAIMALTLLGIRHVKYPQICVSILKWQPPRPLSPELESQLKVLFNTRTYQQWQKIKIN